MRIKVRHGFLWSAVLISIAYNAHTWAQISHTEQEYFAALSNADEMTFQNEFEVPFLIMLEPSQVKQYQKFQDLMKRKAMITYFWHAWNPNPLLPENDYLIVYLQRYAYVREHFAIDEPPYFDDRGGYYLRFGKPTQRFVQGSQYRRAKQFDKEDGYYKFLCQLMNTRDAIVVPPKQFHVAANESWLYKWNTPAGNEEAVVHFVREGIAFREVESIEDAITGINRAAYRAWYWADLIKERATALQSRNLIQTTEDIWDLEDKLEAAYATVITGGILEGLLKVETSNPELKLLKKNEDLIFATRNEKNSLPPAVYAPENALQDIVFLHDIAQFRGNQGGTRLNIRCLTSIHDLSRRDQFPIEDIDLTFSCLVQDNRFSTIAIDEKSVDFSVAEANRIKAPHAVGRLNVTIPPVTNQLTVQIQENAEGRIGFQKIPWQTRDFSQAGLTLSDIELFMELDNQDQNIYPMIEIDGIELAPYPYIEIQKTIPVMAYFEVYNLIESGIVSEYEIALRVTIDESRGGLLKRISSLIKGNEEHSISMIHVRPVTGEIAQELMGLDFRRLAPGAYRLEMIITDARNETLSATIQKAITVVD